MKKIISLLLVFSLVLSCSLVVHASDDDYPYISWNDNLQNDVYFISSLWGAFLSPDISILDVYHEASGKNIANISEWFRFNPDTNELEVKSSYKHDSGDGVTYPSEFLQTLRDMISSYGNRTTNDSGFEFYAEELQIGGTFVPQGLFITKPNNFNYNKNYMNQPKTYNGTFYDCGITSVDTSLYKVFGVFSSNFFTTYLYNVQTGATNTVSYPVVIEKTDLQYNFISASIGRAGAFNGGYYHSCNYPVFSNVNDGKSWASAGGLKKQQEKDVYFTSKFYNWTPTDITVNRDVVINNDWQTINNDYHTEITNEITTTPYMPDTDYNDLLDQIQRLIDDRIPEYTPSGPDNPSGGGDSSGGSENVPSGFFDTIKRYFERIIELLEKMLFWVREDAIVDTVDAISGVISLLLEHSLDVTAKITNEVTNIVDRSKTQIFERASRAWNIGKNKFPFCALFDLYAVLLMFRAPQRIPHYEIPVNFTFFGASYENTVVIDLTQFQPLATFCREVFTILFVVALIMLTVKFIGRDVDKQMNEFGTRYDPR